MSQADVNKNNEKGIRLSTPREELLNTAVRFLQHPSVRNSAVVQQQAFLRSKGLTDEEIRISCERSAALTGERNMHNFDSSAVTKLYSPYVQTPWTKFRDTANTIIVIGGISYGLFIFYQRYVAPWLFGETNKKKSLQQSVAELDIALAKSMQDLRNSVNKVHAELKFLQEQQKQQSLSETSATARQVDELKAEVASVKGLLLNRNQFAVPAKTPPSIPAWQLPADMKQGEEGVVGSGKADADMEEICTSGSGSSETEMVTNNGSDSSLEMIRE